MKLILFILFGSVLVISCSKTQESQLPDDKGITGNYTFTTLGWAKYTGDSSNPDINGGSTMDSTLTATVSYDDITKKVKLKINQSLSLRYLSFELPLIQLKEEQNDNTFYYNFQQQLGHPDSTYHFHNISFNIGQKPGSESHIFISTMYIKHLGGIVDREEISGTGKKQ